MIKLEEYADSLDKCSYCGYCQETCPVFQAELFEPFTARSRINLIESVCLQKSWPLNSDVLRIIDHCMLCTNCTRICSSQIPIDEIVMAARSEINQGWSIKKSIMDKLLTSRNLTSYLLRIAKMAQRVGISPQDVPDLPSKTFTQHHTGVFSPNGPTRAKVAYFVGCGTNFLYPDTGESVISVLNQNGIEVIIPEGQVCCGIPVLAEGDLAAAAKMIERNLDIFSRLEVDAIVTDCTSCGMMFKSKAVKLFPDESKWKSHALQLADKIYEVTDFLAGLGLEKAPGSLAQNYTYHKPCHHAWSKTVGDAPIRLLAAIPKAKFIDTEVQANCCGAAGTFFIKHRRLSEKIRAKRVASIEKMDVSTVVTQCPVCRFYLASQLKNQKVVHPIGFLAQAYKE